MNVLLIAHSTVYLSASHLLKQRHAGHRLSQDTARYSQAMTNMWPYLRIRGTEAAQRRRTYEVSFLGTFIRTRGLPEPIAARLWSSPDDHKQIGMALRYVHQTLRCFEPFTGCWYVSGSCSQGSGSRYPSAPARAWATRRQSRGLGRWWWTCNLSLPTRSGASLSSMTLDWNAGGKRSTCSRRPASPSDTLRSPRSPEGVQMIWMVHLHYPSARTGRNTFGGVLMGHLDLVGRRRCWTN